MRRLLLVDDEEAVAQLLDSYLTRQGYQVTVCPDAESALDLFLKDPSGFDLVIADLTLPGLAGDQMLAEMLAVRPELPAIISSGYPFDPGALKASKDQIAFLQKPYMPSMLLQILKITLAG
jgi:DNA-binding NtrC family response regulator